MKYSIDSAQADEGARLGGDHSSGVI
jgi:hypothetical protein